MPEYKTSAIILRTYDFKDYDKVVVLYSREYGLVRAIAKGVKRPKSKLGGRLEPLIASDLILYEGKNLDIITQCSTTDYFKNLRTDLKKITFAMYYSELITAFGIEEDPQSEEVYNFLYDSIKKLEIAMDNELEHLLVAFQHKIMVMSGYAPMLDRCDHCNKIIEEDSNVYLNSYRGVFICEKCSDRFGNLAEIDYNLYHYLKSLNVKNENTFICDISIVIKAHCIMLNYIKQKTNYKLKTPDLIENICLI
jgi:DNA repair protein RecO (recombination protein O)